MQRINLIIKVILFYFKAFFVLVKTCRVRDRYEIKAGYSAREKYIHFDDTSNKDEYQDRVYSEIKKFFLEKKLSSILDVGCGSGFKLMKYFSDYKTIGLEQEPTLSYVKKNYPDKEWNLSDFNVIPKSKFDMVISVDVIEHIMEPDVFMNFIKKIDCKYIALSTSERDRLYNFKFHAGPPVNVHHIREWTQEEFIRYISKYFKILDANIVSFHDQYVICEKI